MSPIVTNIKRIITPTGDERSLQRIDQAYISIDDEQIIDIGRMKEVNNLSKEDTIDARDCLALPGFVDPHTHLVFAGTRENEFVARSQGRPYSSGGITQTTRSVRESTRDQLIHNGAIYAQRALQAGTTTLEIKSGYGLSVESELKLLRAINDLGQVVPQDVVPTFLGAHAIPEDQHKQKYINDIITEALPTIRREGLAEFCDVFCEEGFYDIQESRKIMKAAKAAGLALKIHADELTSLGGAKLAAELGATSADHLLKTESEGFKALKRSQTIPVLLPGTAFSMNSDYPSISTLNKINHPIAVGTDFNPGTCQIVSIPIIMTIAVLKMGIDPDQLLSAVTREAAKAINREATVGTIETGKQADILLINADNLAQISYFTGHNLIHKVIKKGRVVYSES